MQQGITVNVGDYQSIHLHSSEHETLLDVYLDLLDQVIEWENHFSAMKHWKNKLSDLIKAQGG